MQEHMEETQKNLQFFVDFIASQGLTKKEAARLMGVTPQNLHSSLKKDTMKLSKVQDFIESRGYVMNLSLDRGLERRGSAWVEIQGLIKSNPDMPIKLRRLSFLDVALKRYGIEKKDLARRLDMSYNGVLRWGVCDDISIEYIFRIAELYGFEVTIRIVPKAS